jgi:Tol biopolymer transport system component
MSENKSRFIAHGVATLDVKIKLYLLPKMKGKDMQGKDMIDLEALMRVPYVEPDGEFTLSPVGDMVAYAWNPDGQWEVFLLSIDGSGSPRQITSGPGAKLAPRWSPNGNRIAYVLDLDGGEVYDIFVYDLITGEHQNLTPDTDDAIQPSVC